MEKHSVPEDVGSETRAIEAEGIALLRNGRYGEAEQKFRERLDRFEKWEAANNKRVHKGSPFHNLGLALLYQGASKEAMTFLFFAYIEDTIGAEKEGECDLLPASRVLRGICGVAQEQLRKIDDIVFEIRTEELRQRDPRLHLAIFEKAKPIIQEAINSYQKYLLDTYKYDINGQISLSRKAFADAFRTYQIWFETLMKFQSAISMRIHKGHPLLNMGLSLFLREDIESKMNSAEWFLYAVIENALSASSIDEIAAESSFMILRTQFGVEDKILKSLAEFANEQRGTRIYLDPREILGLYIQKTETQIIIPLLVYLQGFRKQKKSDLLDRAKNETDPNKKGQLLVELMTVLVETDRNFNIGKVDVRTESEQIDIEIHNRSVDPFLQQLDSMIIIVECKNWSKNVGSEEIRDFAMMVQNRPRILCKVGLFITTSDFTEPALNELLKHVREDYLIATIQGKELEDAVSRCSTFSEILKSSILSAGRR